MSFKTFETPILNEHRTDYEPFKLLWPSKNGPMGRWQYPQTFWVMSAPSFFRKTCLASDQGPRRRSSQYPDWNLYRQLMLTKL